MDHNVSYCVIKYGLNSRLKMEKVCSSGSRYLSMSIHCVKTNRSSSRIISTCFQMSHVLLERKLQFIIVRSISMNAISTGQGLSLLSSVKHGLLRLKTKISFLNYLRNLFVLHIQTSSCNIN